MFCVKFRARTNPIRLSVILPWCRKCNFMSAHSRPQTCVLLFIVNGRKSQSPPSWFGNWFCSPAGIDMLYSDQSGLQAVICFQSTGLFFITATPMPPLPLTHRPSNFQHRRVPTPRLQFLNTPLAVDPTPPASFSQTQFHSTLSILPHCWDHPLKRLNSPPGDTKHPRQS